MDVEVIKELMKAFKEAELTKFSLKCDEFELKLDKESKMIHSVVSSNTSECNCIGERTDFSESKTISQDINRNNQ